MLSERDSTALLIIDMQNDFVWPGGPLWVNDAPLIIPVIAKLIGRVDLFRHVFLTQDWHPSDHCSFQGNGGTWPPHCIAGSTGAEIVPTIHKALGNYTVIRKATSRNVDSYSPWEDNEGNPIFDTEDLIDPSIIHLFVCGVATDYCVKETVLHALEYGYNVTLVVDATKGVNIKEHDIDNAIEEMRISGATLTKSELL
jgi:nicotinamidase/pyrazinamidase